MPWLPYSGEGGLVGWGQPPNLVAQPIAGVAEVIRRQREDAYLEQQQQAKELRDTIQQIQRDRAANALTKIYGQQGLIPQEMADAEQGQTGLAAANLYMQAQKGRTYPTDLGVDPSTGQPVNLPLTREQQFKALQLRAALQARYGGQNAAGYGGTTQIDDQGRLWIMGPGHRWMLAPRYMQGQQFQAPAKAPPGSPLSAYLGQMFDPVQKRFRKMTTDDLDFQGAWDDGSGNIQVPVLNPGYDPTYTGQPKAVPGSQTKIYPDQQYLQRPNPYYVKPEPYDRPPTDEPPTDVPGTYFPDTDSPTITHTINIPRSTFQRYGIAPPGSASAGPSAPPPATGAGANPSATPSAGGNAGLQQDINNAQTAIQQGADRDAVVGRLQQKWPNTDFSDL